MTVQVQPFTCIWPFYDLQLQWNWRSSRSHRFFSSIPPFGTLTGKGLRYLYLQCFRNFLNLHLELDLELEFILKLFLAINISDLLDCWCIILALPTLVSVVPLKVDTVFPFPPLWQRNIVRVTLLMHAFFIGTSFFTF